MNNVNDVSAARHRERLSLVHMLKNATRNLPPAYFAMVMATGIISLAAQAMGLPRLAAGLFWLNIGIYLALWALSALRAAWFARQMLDDLLDHQRGPGFLTLVAGTCVLGSQCAIIASQQGVALGLGLAGLALWLGLSYAIFTAFIIKPGKPALEQGIGGAWLLFVVAPQSVAVLAALLAGQWEQPHRAELNFLAACLWLCGGVLYLWLSGLIFYRFTFFKLSAGELAPSYWINMGAMAISTLAGALLIGNAQTAPLLQSLLPFLKGGTLLCWAIGTWWLPALVALGIWRHVYQRVPLKYDPAYWSMVFPLGMYAASTFQMMRAMDLRFLEWVPQGLLYIALLAWAAVFGGLVHSLIHQVRGSAPR